MAALVILTSSACDCGAGTNPAMDGSVDGSPDGASTEGGSVDGSVDGASPDGSVDGSADAAEVAADVARMVELCHAWGDLLRATQRSCCMADEPVDATEGRRRRLSLRHRMRRRLLRPPGVHVDAASGLVQRVSVEGQEVMRGSETVGGFRRYGSSTIGHVQVLRSKAHDVGAALPAADGLRLRGWDESVDGQQRGRLTRRGLDGGRNARGHGRRLGRRRDRRCDRRCDGWVPRRVSGRHLARRRLARRGTRIRQPCRDWGDTVCNAQWTWGCCTPDEVRNAKLAECQTRYYTCCDYLFMGAAWTDGRIHFAVITAEADMAAMRAAAMVCDPDAGSDPSKDLTGRIPVGGDCTPIDAYIDIGNDASAISACDPGLYCKVTRDGSTLHGVCTNLGTVGASCGVNDCVRTLTCGASSTCEEPAADGATCRYWDQCAGGYRDHGVCTSTPHPRSCNM